MLGYIEHNYYVSDAVLVTNKLYLRSIDFIDDDVHMCLVKQLLSFRSAKVREELTDLFTMTCAKVQQHRARILLCRCQETRTKSVRDGSVTPFTYGQLTSSKDIIWSRYLPMSRTLPQLHK